MSVRSFHFSGKRRVVAAILASITLAAVVAAVLVTSFHTKPAFGASAGLCTPNAPVCTENGNAAYAMFDNVSSDGCIYTEVDVQPVTDLAQPGSNGYQSAMVFITKYDSCNNMEIEQGTNEFAPSAQAAFNGTLTFGENLSTGSMVGTAPIYDVNTGNLLYTTSINMTWQGYGATTKSLDSEHFFSQNIVMNMHINGSSRTAEASGTVTDETGSNVITGPTLNAALFNMTGSQVEVFLPN